jgi:putative transposase
MDKAKLQLAVEELLKDYRSPADILGPEGLLKQMTKAVLERAMAAELTHHLGYEKHAAAGRGSGNSRNGTTRKKVQSDFGEVELEIPRDRNGTFEPQLIGKHERRFTGFDDKIVSMYGRGMTTREIEAHLREIYGVDVSPTLISEVTDAVNEELRRWQNRPLEPIYGIVYMDALMVKTRYEGRVDNRAVYTAIGVDMEGNKEVLGLWMSGNEGARQWLQLLTELRNRGLKDVLIACVDGLKGFPEAIEAVFPKAEVQLCIVHMTRASLNFVNWKERQKVAGDLKMIYGAATAAQAEMELAEFEQKWGRKYPTIGPLWRRNWERVIPFFAYPPEIRRVIYTTNAVEGLNRSLRKVIKNRGSFPSDDAALKLLYLAQKNASANWKFVQGWRDALTQFTVRHGERIEAALARPAK